MTAFGDIAQTTIDGVAAGALYALFALGFTMIFGVIRRANLAYGSSVMLGLYVATLAWMTFDISIVLCFAIASAVAIAAGLYVQVLCFPSRAADRQQPNDAHRLMVSVAASFAVWMQLEELATLNMPAHLYPFPALAGDAVIELVGLSIRSDALIVLVSALAVCAALYLTLYRTRFGLGIRATVDLPRAASVVGINVSGVFRKAFVIAAIVGTIGAFAACATAEQLTPKLGMWLTLKAMLAMMVGGLGSLRGAVVAGVALGVLEAHVQRHFGPQLRDASTYLLLFAVLASRAWRPGAATQFGVGVFGGRGVR